MAVTLEEKKVQLEAMVRERDIASRRIEELKAQLKAAVERDDKRLQAFLQDDLAQQEKILKAVKDELEVVGRSVKTRLNRASER
jgi:glucose-6-phosphate-specific signal transduction histidine kinase